MQRLNGSIAYREQALVESNDFGLEDLRSGLLCQRRVHWSIWAVNARRRFDGRYQGQSIVTPFGQECEPFRL